MTGYSLDILVKLKNNFLTTPLKIDTKTNEIIFPCFECDFKKENC